MNVGLSIRTAIDAGGRGKQLKLGWAGQAALTAGRESDGDGLWWINHGGSGEMKGCRLRDERASTVVAATAVL